MLHVINHPDTCNPDKPWDILARRHVEQWNQYIHTGCVSQYFQQVVEPIHKHWFKIFQHVYDTGQPFVLLSSAPQSFPKQLSGEQVTHASIIHLTPLHNC